MTTAAPLTQPLAVPLSLPTPTSDPSPSAPPSVPESSATSHPLTTAPDESAKDGQEAVNPPVPMVHLRVLVISGDSHVFTFEPETTVGRMKELVWSMWPSDWSSPAQPPSPSSLRVLHLGRILSDDSTLSSNNLPAALPPTVPTTVHLSVRSFSIRAEDDTKKPSLLNPAGPRSGRNSAGGRDSNVSGCKCVIS